MCGGTPTPDDLAAVQNFAAALAQPTKHLQALALMEWQVDQYPEYAEALAKHTLDPTPWLCRDTDPMERYEDDCGDDLLKPRPEFCQHRECYVRPV